MSFIERGVISNNRKIAARLPYAVRTIALYPNPDFKSRCPGRIESSVSVSGQPRKIEGTKS